MSERRPSGLGTSGAEQVARRLADHERRISGLEAREYEPFPGWRLHRVGIGDAAEIRLLYVPTGVATTIGTA